MCSTTFRGPTIFRASESEILGSYEVMTYCSNPSLIFINELNIEYVNNENVASTSNRAYPKLNFGVDGVEVSIQ